MGVLGLGLRVGGGGALRAKSLTATVSLTTGLLTTVSTFGLLAPVGYAKTGGSANLTIGAATGNITAAAALTAGASQSLTGTATGSDGCVLPFTATLTGVASGTPTPTPAPTPTQVIHALLAFGQSGMVGRGAIVAGADTVQAKIKAVGALSTDAATFRKIVANDLPLYTPDDSVANNYLSPANSAARGVLPTLGADDLIFVTNSAVGGTALASGSARWAPGNPGGDLYEAAIAQFNATLALLATTYPSATIVPVFLWSQGESDGDAAVSQATYYAPLSGVIAGVRTRVAGTASARFIIGAMPAGAILYRKLSGTGDLGPIDAAHRQAAQDIAGVSYVAGPIGFDDLLHRNSAGNRLIGIPMGQAAIGINTVGFDAVLTTVTEGNSGTTIITFRASRTSKVGALNVNCAFAPGTTDASDYVGGVLPGDKVLSFPDGQISASFTVSIAGDTVFEPDEAFTYTMQAPGGGWGLGAQSVATGTITNDDSGGVSTNLVSSPNALEAWTGTNLTVTADAVTDPNGGAAFDRLTDNTTAAAHILAAPTVGGGSVTSGSTYTASEVFKMEVGSSRYVQISLASARFGSNAWASFDLVGVVPGAFGPSASNATIAAVGNGSYLVSFNAVATSTGIPQLVIAMSDTAPIGRNPSYAGTGKTILAKNAQIVAGTIANAF